MNKSGCSPVALVGSWRIEEPRRCWLVSPDRRAARAEAVSIQEPARLVVLLVGSWSRGGAGCVAASIQEPAQLSRLQGCPGTARPVASRAILTRHLLQNL